MIDLTRLYCGEKTAGESIRYGWRHRDKGTVASAMERRPVVVWNLTRTCNLKCLHCYSDSHAQIYPGELTTDEALQVIEDLAQFKIPALLLSGGEPLLRKDLFILADEAKRQGLRVTLSTNGTLITRSIAEKIKETGFTYVGVSLDGVEETHDQFRGVKGAFEKTLQAIRYCKEVGQKVGLRLTMTRHTIQSLPQIFDLMVKEKIDRACFYHLVFTGRGRFISKEALSHEEMRMALDIILKWTRSLNPKTEIGPRNSTQDLGHLGLQKASTDICQCMSTFPPSGTLSSGQSGSSSCVSVHAPISVLGLKESGFEKEILTVGNPVDGVYLYLKLKEEKEGVQAQEVLDLISLNGGGQFGSGVGLGCIDFYGNVHPDQFSMGVTLGNVKERPFSQIWMDLNNELLRGLKNRLPLLKGKCKSCDWKNQCGGGLRTRAHLAFGDPWAEDPGCYLTLKEIGARNK